MQRSWLLLALGLSCSVATSTFGQSRESGPTHERPSSAPTRASSIEITGTGVAIRAAPTTRSPRRGTIRQGTRVRRLGHAPGAGCQSDWIQIAERAFVCGTFTRWSDLAPAGDALPIVPEGALLPRSYAFVGVDGTWAYRHPQDYFMDDWSESLGRGFGIVIADQTTISGVRFVRSTQGLWIPASEVRYARGSEFEGVELDGDLDIGWVARRRARIRTAEGTRIVAQRQPVRISGEHDGIVDTELGQIRARDLVRPTPSEPPEEVRNDQMWIDIEIQTQTLVLYRGSTPIFATLISSGRNHRTPVGEFHVWAKLAEDTMDDLGRTDVERNYAIEGVPWVQYFHEGIGLHAAFWHDDFGRPRSHGCINLSPRDARRLFGVTEPALPDGWDAITTLGAEPGTLVRVR